MTSIYGSIHPTNLKRNVAVLPADSRGVVKGRFNYKTEENSTETLGAIHVLFFFSGFEVA